MNIIIAGAPASGKGTQCETIKDEFGVVHLSTGDMLRAAVADGTEVGKLAKDFMDSGKLVPDEVIIGVVRPFIIHHSIIIQTSRVFSSIYLNLSLICHSIAPAFSIEGERPPRC